ncbi:MAG: uroporphyrinogen decarboxylase family protein [Candidatus Latescibacteria bacterium]|jgi:uroporphyrinogen-III decarboxylase|nr:uroporphyrinogen decarboxylase family protein [Candidatus Latescibacterota bacterium]
MTNRERLLAIMAGKPPDSIPWIPRLLLWYNARKKAGDLPERYRDWSLRNIERDLGIGTPARDGHVFRAVQKGVEVRQRQLNEMELLTEYITPVGAVTMLHRGSELLRRMDIADLQVEFVLKRREDYAVVEYLIEHTDYIPTYEEYDAYEQEVGDAGYPLVAGGDCPFHQWMRGLTGYENAYYHLNDYPDEVERLLALMTQRDREIVWPLIADSPAKLILHGVHFSSQMTPPPIFELFILPYYQDLSELLCSRDKTLTLHGDNDTRLILSHIEQAGFGMVECFVSHPMVETTLTEARAEWGSRVIIWGGVPSSILEEPYSDAEFEAYMEEIFRTIAPGDAFILGVADNVMPGAKLERVQRITEMVAQYGRYPIDVRGLSA